MKNIYPLIAIFLLPVLLLFLNTSDGKNNLKYNATKDSLRYTGEKHLRNIRQLTFGGNNAEAYWSFDDKQLIFQSDWDKINKHGCDQIFRMNTAGTPLPNGEQYQLSRFGSRRLARRR